MPLKYALNNKRQRFFVNGNVTVEFYKAAKVQYWRYFNEMGAGIDVKKYYDFAKGEKWEGFTIDPIAVQIIEFGGSDFLSNGIFNANVVLVRINSEGIQQIVRYDNTIMKLIIKTSTNKKDSDLEVEKQRLQKSVNEAVVASGKSFNTISNLIKTKNITKEQYAKLVDLAYTHNASVEALKNIDGIRVDVKRIEANEAPVKKVVAGKKVIVKGKKKGKKVSGSDYVGVLPLILILAISALVVGGATYLISDYIQGRKEVDKIKANFDAIAQAQAFKLQVAKDETAGIITKDQAKELKKDINKDIEVLEKATEGLEKKDKGLFENAQNTILIVGGVALVLKISKVI
jgi:hypothetical protein